MNELNISHADVPFILVNGGGEAVQPTQPVTLYLTITVSANVPSPIFPNNAPEMPIKRDDSPAEEATQPSVVPDPGGPVQSSAPEPLLHSPESLSVEAGTPMAHVQAETSPTEKVLIALRRADEAKKPIDRKNTWKGAVSRIKWVMGIVSPIADVRAISILPLFD